MQTFMTNEELIVLSAVFASEEKLALIRKIVLSPLCNKYQFRVLVAKSALKQFSDLGTTALGIDDARSLKRQLKSLKPSIVQTFSINDHRAAVHFWTHPYYLLATHLNAGQAIVSGKMNHLIYNRLTDLNLFMDRAAMDHNEQSGYLTLNCPVVLTQEQQGADSVYNMFILQLAGLNRAMQTEPGFIEKRAGHHDAVRLR